MINCKPSIFIKVKMPKLNRNCTINYMGILQVKITSYADNMNFYISEETLETPLICYSKTKQNKRFTNHNVRQCPWQTSK
uniref:Uncharacterized protein n=1 Tax=Rhizophora mucronata TaxID=61149 RepID=A0A2P2QRQ1_RHIMU